MIKERLTINGDTVTINSSIMGKIEVPVAKIPKMFNEHRQSLQINRLKMVLTEREVDQLKQLL